MDSVMLVAADVARMHIQSDVAHADPAQVMQFEHLMRDAQTRPAGVEVGGDEYVARPESPFDALGSNLLRVGSELSHNFQTRLDQANVTVREFDPANPNAMQQLVELQHGVLSASFQLHFATSLVESANRGFSTLFHMQG